MGVTHSQRLPCIVVQMVRGAVLFPLLGAIAIVASCRDPTEIRLVLTTDLASCPPIAASKEPGTTTITIGPDFASLEGAPGATAATCAPSSPREIGDLVVVPSGDRGAEIAIEIVAGLGREACAVRTPGASLAGCVVARRRLRFVAHTPLLLPIELRQDCAGVRCEPEYTCLAGGCVSAACVDPACSNLAPPPGTPTPPPPGSLTDARADVGGRDGASDGDATTTRVDAGPCGPFTAGIDCPPSGPCAAQAEQCCNGACSPSGDGCTLKPVNVSLKCDETADCPAGTVCCIHHAVIPSVYSQCEVSCGSDPALADQVCKQDCECGGPSCTSDCYGVKTCGGGCPTAG